MSSTINDPRDAAAPRRLLRDLALVARRQRWLIAVCAGVGLLAAGGAAALLPAEYRATATLRVEDPAKALPVAVGSALVGGTGVGTELEVLRSRTLAGAVVDSLGLQLEVRGTVAAHRDEIVQAVRVVPGADSATFALTRRAGRFEVRSGTGAPLGSVAPGGEVRLPGLVARLAPGAETHERITLVLVERDRAISDLLGALEVERPNRDANIIRVGYRGRDPRLAREVPNVLAARFVELRQAAQKTAARSTAHFLRQQLDTLAVQLARSEEALRHFRESERVIDLQVEGSTQVGHLAQMQAERSALEAERSSLASLVAAAEAESRTAAAGAASPFRRLVAFPALMRTSTASEILGTLSHLEQQRAELTTRRRATDPDVEVLSRRIGEVEGQLQAMVETYLAGLNNQIRSIDGTLGGYQARLDRIPAAELEFARRSRQPKVLSDMYVALQTRLKEAEIAEAVEDPSARLVDAAVLPTGPVTPGRRLIAAAGLILGLMTGVAFGHIREFRDTTVRTTGDLGLASGGPILAMIPRIGAAPRALPSLGGSWRSRIRLPAPVGGTGTAAVLPLPAAGAAPGGDLFDVTPLSDAYEWLFTGLQFAAAQPQPRRILFTSALPGDGKTTTAVNLGIVMARRGLRVLVIDADLRRGTVGERLGAEPGPGLAEVLAGTAHVDGALRWREVGGEARLGFLPAGTATLPPAQLLSSPRMRALLTWAGARYDQVIIDSPPINLVSDAALLAGQVDGVVLVARNGVTPFEALTHATEQLRRTRAEVFGAVMNDVDFERAGYEDGAYRWYGYGKRYYADAR